ncbi:hypothetical protein OG470_22550 [Micromonospora sp. NBC_00389]
MRHLVGLGVDLGLRGDDGDVAGPAGQRREEVNLGAVGVGGAADHLAVEAYLHQPVGLVNSVRWL